MVFFWHFELKSNVRKNLEKLNKYEENINAYNFNFINKRLIRYKSLFDGKDDNLKYSLDEDQRLAVVKDDKHNLVIAAAGSGKTSVITSKIAYLIRRKDSVNKNKILALAYTRVAAEEMQNKLRRDYKIDINISTFHKFGRSIILEHTQTQPRLPFDGDNAKQKFKKIVEKIFNKCLEEKFFQDLLIEYLACFLDEEVDETSFEEKEEYYEYMRNKKYKTLTNIEVKSISERDIANFLFKNKIRFEYELKVNWADNDEQHKQYQPDFYLPDYDIYIEHWGLNEKNEVPEWFSISSDKYLEKRDWAIKQFRKYDKKFVETFEYENTKKVLIEVLQNRLKTLSK